MGEKIKIYLVAGEPSGDLLGSRLMRAFKRAFGKNVSFCGVGGETMQKEGLHSLFDIRDLAVMGLMEVVPSIPRILKRLNSVVKDIEVQHPDVIITIDSYSFSARVHAALKKANCPIAHFHYVAPQVWAWKKKRARQVHRLFDHLFVLLPNEPKYFEPYGMATTFVGHPVVESLAAQGKGNDFKKRYRIPEQSFVLLMLPGSRKNEVRYLLSDFMQAAEQMQKKHPNLYVVVPTVQTVEKTVRKQLAHWFVPHVIVLGEEERYHAFAAADVALAASGTVSLELAMAGVKHIIAYRVSPLTAMIVKRLIQIRFVNLINILSDKEIIPEMIQDKCTPDQLAFQLERLIQAPAQEVMPALKLLGVGETMTPSDRVVQKVRELIGK